MFAHFSNVLIYPHATHLHRFLHSRLYEDIPCTYCAPHCWIIFCCWMMFPFLICKLRIFMWRSLINKYHHAACCSVWFLLHFSRSLSSLQMVLDIKNLLDFFYSSRFPFFPSHVYNFMCIRWRRYSSETFWFEIRCSILYPFIFKWLSYHVPIEMASIHRRYWL